MLHTPPMPYFHQGLSNPYNRNEPFNSLDSLPYNSARSPLTPQHPNQQQYRRLLSQRPDLKRPQQHTAHQPQLHQQHDVATDSAIYASPLPHVPPAAELLLRRKTPGGGAILGGFDAAPSADSMMYGAYNGGFGVARPVKHILLNNTGLPPTNIPQNLQIPDEVVANKFASLIGGDNSYNLRPLHQPMISHHQQVMMAGASVPLIGHQIQNFEGMLAPHGQLPQLIAPSPVTTWQPNFLHPPFDTNPSQNPSRPDAAVSETSRPAIPSRRSSYSWESQGFRTDNLVPSFIPSSHKRTGVGTFMVPARVVGNIPQQPQPSEQWGQLGDGVPPFQSGTEHYLPVHLATNGLQHTAPQVPQLNLPQHVGAKFSAPYADAFHYRLGPHSVISTSDPLLRERVLAWATQIYQDLRSSLASLRQLQANSPPHAHGRPHANSNLGAMQQQPRHPLWRNNSEGSVVQLRQQQMLPQSQLQIPQQPVRPNIGNVENGTKGSLKGSNDRVSDGDSLFDARSHKRRKLDGQSTEEVHVNNPAVPYTPNLPPPRYQSNVVQDVYSSGTQFSALSHGPLGPVRQDMQILNPAMKYPHQVVGVIQNPAQQRMAVAHSKQYQYAAGRLGLHTQHMSAGMSALEILGRINADHQWKWAEGMVLAGGLCYVLGDHSNAIQWCTRALEVDPNNVEALSTVGSSMLALGHKDEAEKHWRQAIKLKPNHFEIIEYLLGLLCQEQKNREAISIIEFVENALRCPNPSDPLWDRNSSMDTTSETSAAALSLNSACSSPEVMAHDYHHDVDEHHPSSAMYATSGPSHRPPKAPSRYHVPSSENAKLLQLVHAKGNMLYSFGCNDQAARAFEDAVMVGTGCDIADGIKGLIKKILRVVAVVIEDSSSMRRGTLMETREPMLLTPDRALQTARLVFPPYGELPGLKDIANPSVRKQAVSTTSNSLLSLAKIYQDAMATGAQGKSSSSVRDILALYYLSLSLHPSPSTANNVGILLASVQQAPGMPAVGYIQALGNVPTTPGISMAFNYYHYGLQLDSRHAHLYTNLGSLLKDVGQLPSAVRMYEYAVGCDPKFDIALANLANAVKDQGRINDAIGYYRRAVSVSPDFAEAVCGLANALNSVCDWAGRGGVVRSRDRWHVDEANMLIDARAEGRECSGLTKRVVDIVEKQLAESENWGKGLLSPEVVDVLLRDIRKVTGDNAAGDRMKAFRQLIESWRESGWQGTKILRLVERITKRLSWKWYHDKHVLGLSKPATEYYRPMLPPGLTVPSAPTVLPFHTFTCPLSPEQVRMISQRNGVRVSCSTLKSPWLPPQVYPPPAPPSPQLRVGYVSSDFNNHPLAHLMQSVFGFHNPSKVTAFCYATSPSDNSVHRHKIEAEAPVFIDASTWGTDRLVSQIVNDGIHILVNLNGFTRGARNEVFAARPAPLQMSFMGFAGTLGAEWCDYLFADTTAVPPSTLRPRRKTLNWVQPSIDEWEEDGKGDWVYTENIIYGRYSLFCNDHKQSAADANEPYHNWEVEQARRWKMRKELFPQLRDDQIILGNFNQLYKIEPTTFRSWLRILSRVPNAVLWLLRFPELGEPNIRKTAEMWASSEVASRIIFTDVAPKHLHISRATVCDIFLDTPECNAHTTAADVVWSGTPLLTLPRHQHKMCSRIAASIIKAAVPPTDEGRAASDMLVASDEDDYENKAVKLATTLTYDHNGKATGQLFNIRKILFESRWTSALFDTRRWVSDLEDGFQRAWKLWEKGETDDIWL